MYTNEQKITHKVLPDELLQHLNELTEQKVVTLIFYSTDTLLKLPSLTLMLNTEQDCANTNAKEWVKHAAGLYKVFICILPKDYFAKYDFIVPLMFVYLNCSVSHIIYQSRRFVWNACFKAYADKNKKNHLANMNKWFEYDWDVYQFSELNYLELLMRNDRYRSACLLVMREVLSNVLSIYRMILFYRFDVFYFNDKNILNAIFEYTKIQDELFKKDAFAQKRLMALLSMKDDKIRSKNEPPAEFSTQILEDTMTTLSDWVHCEALKLYAKRFKKLKKRNCFKEGSEDALWRLEIKEEWGI